MKKFFNAKLFKYENMGLFRSKKKEKSSENVFLSFSETVRKNIKNYIGPHSNVLKFAPDFFDLIVKLYKKEIPYPYREMINSAISYFVLPDDLLPEDELGAFGYLDDLYLCAYIVKKFEGNKNLSGIVEELWTQPEDVFKISTRIMEELENTQNQDLKEALSSILLFTGIADLEEELKKKEKIDTSPQIIEPVADEEKITLSEEDIFGDVEILLEESDRIGEELRKISFSEIRTEKSIERAPTMNDEELLQNKLPVYVILHMAKKAKYNNILKKNERKALFDIAHKKMEKIKLTEKQIMYLESLIQKAISQGIVDAPCEDEPCEKCEELKEIVTQSKKHLDEAIICPYCNKKFKNKEFLRQHIKRKHPQ